MRTIQVPLAPNLTHPSVIVIRTRSSVHQCIIEQSYNKAQEHDPPGDILVKVREDGEVKCKTCRRWKPAEKVNSRGECYTHTRKRMMESMKQIKSKKGPYYKRYLQGIRAGAKNYTAWAKSLE